GGAGREWAAVGQVDKWIAYRNVCDTGKIVREKAFGWQPHRLDETPPRRLIQMRRQDAIELGERNVCILGDFRDELSRDELVLRKETRFGLS
uniref:hypothetical protein n=1 Tax=Psychrobacter sp. CAL346-MNA-CIBAN-0220 TaxID=3140457 RepID=UPI00332442D3